MGPQAGNGHGLGLGPQAGNGHSLGLGTQPGGQQGRLEMPVVLDDGRMSRPTEEPSSVEAALREAVEAIRPALQADGGDMRVLELREDEGVVDIELMGACGGCPMSSLTLKAGIDRILKDRVPGLVEVRTKGIDCDVDALA